MSSRTQPTDASTPGGPVRRARNARGQGENLRQEIVEAMLRLIADEQRMQPVPLSLREVAREAGITAPAIYRHFADKDELTRAVLDHLFGQLLTALDEADATAETKHAAPGRRLGALAHAYCRFAEANPECFRVMFQAVGLQGDGPKQVAVRWRTAVARLAETGIRLTQDPDAAALSVWSSVHGRLALNQTVDSMWPTAEAHEFVDELIRSLETVDSATR